MAAKLSQDTTIITEEKADLNLHESDIPGAELTKPPEQCTKIILKRWLLCRGAKVSGNRSELIQR